LHPCDVTVTSPDCGSSPVRPFLAAPWQDSIPALLSTGSSGISSRRPRVHVALTFMAWWMRAMESKAALQLPALRCGSRNALHVTATLPRQLHYEHAAAAV
jgi:hypothetical protein